MDKFTSMSSTPASASAVSNDDGRWVVGMTSVDNLLFVLHAPSQQQIQVYDITSFKQQRALQVKDLSDDTWVNCGLTSCAINKCVYVSDCRKQNVHKIKLSNCNKVSSWRVGRSPCGLSINTACNLLVSCYEVNTIQEYTTKGIMVREICLKLNELRPRHAIQLTGSQFVVSCWNATSSAHDVVEIDIRKGQVVVSYKNRLRSTTRHKFNEPSHLSVDTSNDCILVADRDNKRIVILNRSLIGCARELDVTSVDGGLQSPSCLYFDASRNRLFVGESSGWGRVLAFDNFV